MPKIPLPKIPLMEIGPPKRRRSAKHLLEDWACLADGYGPALTEDFPDLVKETKDLLGVLQTFTDVEIVDGPGASRCSIRLNGVEMIATGWSAKRDYSAGFTIVNVDLMVDGLRVLTLAEDKADAEGTNGDE